MSRVLITLVVLISLSASSLAAWNITVHNVTKTSVRIKWQPYAFIDSFRDATVNQFAHFVNSTSSFVQNRFVTRLLKTPTTPSTNVAYNTSTSFMNANIGGRCGLKFNYTTLSSFGINMTQIIGVSFNMKKTNGKVAVAINAYDREDSGDIRTGKATVTTTGMRFIPFNISASSGTAGSMNTLIITLRDLEDKRKTFQTKEFFLRESPALTYIVDVTQYAGPRVFIRAIPITDDIKTNGLLVAGLKANTFYFINITPNLGAAAGTYVPGIFSLGFQTPA